MRRKRKKINETKYIDYYKEHKKQQLKKKNYGEKINEKVTRHKFTLKKKKKTLLSKNEAKCTLTKKNKRGRNESRTQTQTRPTHIYLVRLNTHGQEYACPAKVAH